MDAVMVPDISRTVQKWRNKPGTLIMALHEIQNRYGYVPRNVSLQLSQLMGVPLARIYEVVTFYNYFRLEPPAKHNVAVCMGTACYLKGAEGLVATLKTDLGVDSGQTTEDGQFHAENVRCVGCCGLAPVVVVDGQTLSKVTPDGLLAKVKECRGEESTKP
jgi:NADH-quinone oxidoreductase subunit E